DHASGPGAAATAARRGVVLARAALRARAGRPVDPSTPEGRLVEKLAAADEIVLADAGRTATVATRVAAAALGRRVADAPATAPHAAPATVEPPEWEYAPERWARPVRGWDSRSVAEAERRRTPAFRAALASPRPLAVTHEADDPGGDDPAAHNVLVSFGYVLALAAGGRERVSILDWGGGVGHYYALARELLPSVEIEYHCRDLPALVEVGRELQPEGRFWADDTPLRRRYALVVASASLQYSPDWRATLEALARSTGSYLFVARLPVAFRAASFVVLQRPHAYGY